MPKHIPVYDLNKPDGGNQIPVSLGPNTPVYSTYTGRLVGYGPIPYGVPGDAPLGHDNYGLNFHVVTYSRTDNSFMVHNAGEPFRPRTFY